MTRTWSQCIWSLVLTIAVGLSVCAGPAQGGLFGLCQLIANFDNPDVGYQYGVGPYGGGGSLYIWGPPDYGAAKYRSERISQFGLERNFRQQEVISDRLWEESRRANQLARERSRDYQQGWIHRMTGTAPGWAVRPTRETRLEQQEPLERVVTGELDWNTGLIQWPNLLTLPLFADSRSKIEAEFDAYCKAKAHANTGRDHTNLLQAIESLRGQLKGIGQQVRAHQFLVSLRFLNQFEEELTGPETKTAEK